MHKVIEGLRVCTMLPSRPSYIPKSRPKGSKAVGCAYERKIGKKLKKIWPDLVSGQWFQYVDQHGRSCCQTDHYVVLDDQVLLLECKLTQTDVAFTQMDQLYKPILRML